MVSRWHWVHCGNGGTARGEQGDWEGDKEGDRLRESVQEVVELGDSGRSVFTLTQVSSLGLLLQLPRWSEASRASILKSVLRLAELVLVSAILR